MIADYTTNVSTHRIDSSAGDTKGEGATALDALMVVG